MQTYICHPNREGKYLNPFSVKAQNIANLRRNLISDYIGVFDFIEVEAGRSSGILDLPPARGMGMGAIWNGKYVDPKTGRLKGGY